MGIATFLRGASAEKRGPVAFVVHHERQGFPMAFADRTQGEGPIKLFTNLREARTWVEQMLHEPERGPERGPALAAVPQPHDRWSPPDRRGVLFRGQPATRGPPEDAQRRLISGA